MKNKNNEAERIEIRMKIFNIVSVIILGIFCIPLLILATKSDLTSMLWLAILIATMYTFIDIWALVNTSEFSDQTKLKRFSDIFNRFFQDLGSPLAMVIIGYAFAKM